MIPRNMARFLWLMISFLCCSTFLQGEEAPSFTIRVAVLRDIPKLDQALALLCKHEYRGMVRVVQIKEGSYVAVNTLGIEDYLLDVVVCEMDPHGPLEALKAQAIAARSHALYQASISHEQPYDLVANISQAYFGKSALSKNVVLAIEATRGQYLTYENKLIPTYFHASCGGHTESVKNVWPSKQSTETSSDLKLPGAVPCPYCAESKENQWSWKVSALALQRALKHAGYKIDGLSSVSVAERAPSSHVLTVLVSHQKNDLLIPAEKFRSLLGYSKLKSTLFDIQHVTQDDRGTDDFVFKGDGWGHGVGLCQFGAQEMAENGASCGHILSYYFPNSLIQSYLSNTSAISMR